MMQTFTYILCDVFKLFVPKIQITLLDEIEIHFQDIFIY